MIVWIDAPAISISHVCVFFILLCAILYNFIHCKVANNSKKIQQLKIATEKATECYLAYFM